MKRFMQLVPVIAALLCALWLIGKAIPPRDADGSFAVHAFGQVPVVYQGRVKPYDTLARNALIVISDRQFFRDADDERRPAIEWLLDVAAQSPRAAEHQVFRIHNLQLQTQLGLERRRGYRYAWAEFGQRFPDIERQAAQASRLDPGERDVYDGQVLELYHKVSLYRVLSEVHAVPIMADGHANLELAARRMQVLERFSLPHAIPPAGEGEEWTPLLRAVVDGAAMQKTPPVAEALVSALTAWRTGDVAGFNAKVAVLDDLTTSAPEVSPGRLRFEAAFNHAAPFYHSAVLYVLAFLLGAFAWLGWSDMLRPTTSWILGVTLVAHTAAIAARVYISGYPPITNLYGTAVFIGWGCVVLGLLLESIYGIGIGNLLAATVGFLTLVIAHFLAGDGDTLQMMQAVLDTKFWLATHVIIINFGYAATFLAGGLGVLFILRGVLTRSLDRVTERAIGRMMYGTLCFALLLSFVGTVLGGLWADDSWGRFWGWDPKENGALMIVLWTALILHARWGGIVKARGIATLSVFGGIITAWSWFGVNQLGVGLHSYGFTDSVTFWLIIFVGSQLLVMGLGMLPRRLWRSSLPRNLESGALKSDAGPPSTAMPDPAS